MSQPAPFLDLWFNTYSWHNYSPTENFRDATTPEDAQRPVASPANGGDARTVSPFHSQTPTPTPALRDGLPLLHLAEWDETKIYDKRPPTCIQYSIEWKLTVNSKVVSKDTEQNLVLAPSDFWERTLRAKLDKLVKRKLPSNKSYKVDDTNIVVSVRHRSEGDLVKRFDNLNVEWVVVESQLQAWSYLFRTGRRLKIDVSFNYIEVGANATMPVRRGTKRGFTSTTRQMAAQREMHILQKRILSINHRSVTKCTGSCGAPDHRAT